PSLTMAPYCVSAPVKGPATAILMVSAMAPAEKDKPAAMPSAATMGVKRIFITPPESSQERIHRNNGVGRTRVSGFTLGQPDGKPHGIAPAIGALLKQAAQHPGVLFVDVEPASEQVDRRLVIGLVRNSQCNARRFSHGFIALDQHTDHLFGVRHGIRLGYGRQTRVLGISPRRIMPQRANPLCDVVIPPFL